jgi:photosystem II stability/assembly factor-like uncharacterized protein
MTRTPLAAPRPRAGLALLAALSMLSLAAPPGAAAPADRPRAASRRPADVEAAFFKALPWREVGPYRGGRVSAVEGVASQPSTYYMGATGGGVWKTIDGGATWKNVSDGFFGGSIGAVAVAPSDPNVVYVGTGEETLRGNVSPGHGLWRSTDAGKSWTFLGLADSQQVARLRVHPKDPDLVYAAVLGHAFGPNETRGVYRSRDGGRSWERVLYAGPDAGAVDLAMDPTNPRILFAATWRVRRTPYSFESGGPGSALWRSTDGGDHWRELTAAPRETSGLPKGALGRIGVAVSPADPRVVYAVVEAEEGGVLRSADGGETWKKVNGDRDLRQRAWYYSRIYADPRDADTAYVVNVRFWRSKDGGKSFADVDTPHGDDHDLWIAPDDPKRMIEGSDGGAVVSTDGGATWSSVLNQPTAQIYRAAVDTAVPYRLLGAQQDNSAFRIRHRSADEGIGPADWEETAGGESGYIVADPSDPDVVYGGSYGGLLVRRDHRTGEVRDTNPWPDNPMGWGDAELRYRFQWNFPIAFSPHDPHTLYAAANVLFRTTDGGGSWQAMSPDLTRDDKSKEGPTGGPITKDNTSVEYYGTIFCVAESPLAAGLLWTGSDDGLVHLTRDGGRTWRDVTPKGAPKWLMWNAIEPSPYEAGGAYLAGTLYKADDFHPYLYRTSDYGATWTKIVDGIPADHFTRVVRADPRRRGLLFAGTERGLFASFDDGAHWRPAQGKLPIVPVTDLLVHEGSLIAATQGRGYWMLDDLSPLEQWSDGLAGKPVHLFAPGPSMRLRVQSAKKPPVNQGTNPPAGVVLSYLLADQPPGAPVKLEILTPDGKLVRVFAGEVKPAAPKEGDKEPEGKKAKEEAPKQAGAPARAAVPETASGEPPAAPQAAEESKKDEKKEDKEPRVPAEPGFNQFAWDLRYPPAKKFDGLVLWDRGGLDGPRAVPGRYQARLTVGRETATVPFELRPDPRARVTQADLEKQLAFLLAAHDELAKAHEAIGRIRAAHAQLADLEKRLGAGADRKPLVDAAKELDRKLTAIEEALYQTKNRSEEDPLNFPIRLNDKLAGVAASAGLGDNPPTAQAEAVREQLTAAIDAQLAKLQALWDQDLPAFNRKVRDADVPAIGFAPEKGEGR